MIAWKKILVKDNLLLSNEIITGDFQSLAGGLQIRWAGSADDSSATVDDEFEVEVAGYNEENDLNHTTSRKMTRGGVGIYGNKGT